VIRKGKRKNEATPLWFIKSLVMAYKRGERMGTRWGSSTKDHGWGKNQPLRPKLRKRTIRVRGKKRGQRGPEHKELIPLELQGGKKRSIYQPKGLLPGGE